MIEPIDWEHLGLASWPEEHPPQHSAGAEASETRDDGSSSEESDNEESADKPTTEEDLADRAFGCLTKVAPRMRMLQGTYRDIMRHLTGTRPEAGGMLLGPKCSSLVTHYVPDRKGHATAVSFTLDAPSLNRILRKFLDCDLDAKGLVHSHPSGCTVPSAGDLWYVRKLFANDKNQGAGEFLLPIVCDGELYPYVIPASDPNRVVLADLLLV